MFICLRFVPEDRRTVYVYHSRWSRDFDCIYKVLLMISFCIVQVWHDHIISVYYIR